MTPTLVGAGPVGAEVVVDGEAALAVDVPACARAQDEKASAIVSKKISLRVMFMV